MGPENFCYWLQGLFELNNNTKLDDRQVQIIKDHLKLVFKKETPNRVAYIPQFSYADKDPVNLPIPRAEDGLPGCRMPLNDIKDLLIWGPQGSC